MRLYNLVRFWPSKAIFARPPEPLPGAIRKKDFRSDINGLRAIAVLGVVFFHYGFKFMPGGYVGVDVFFVISGFLMTQIIAGRLQGQRFKLWDFYLARGRRIVPALLFLCFVLSVLGMLALDPVAFVELAQQVVSSLLFISNMQFSSEAGYFDVSSTTKWLLHTWSLSVEWQFYVVYPIVLMAIWRFRPSIWLLRASLIAGCILSLIFCLFLFHYRPAAAFFWLPPRAWELLMGGVVAVAAPIRSAILARAAQIGGLALILACMLSFDEYTAWPSLLTILPVVGTAAVIWANKGSSRLTGNPPLRLIGLWSYSIYLWHWPLGVALQYAEIPVSPGSSFCCWPF